jgi:hypothetical protein
MLADGQIKGDELMQLLHGLKGIQNITRAFAFGPIGADSEQVPAVQNSGFGQALCLYLANGGCPA